MPEDYRKKEGIMKVNEIMRPARTIAQDETVKEAAKEMNEHRIGSLIVLNDRKGIAGIITEGDILGKVTAENKLPSSVNVCQIMTKKLITIEPDAKIDDAVYLMIKHKIKKLPVVGEKDDLLGIVTTTDLINNSDDLGQFYMFD